MHLVRVAGLVARVVRRSILLQLPVRVMAGHAIQTAVTAEEAGAVRPQAPSP
jgi:hypothetical protein